MIRPLLSRISPGGDRGRLSILIFHRVLPEPDPLFPEEPDARRFDEICTWLARWFNVLPLDEAAQCLRSGTLPPRALCITFDDGYEDNHSLALPILQRHGLTATFFIATGYLDGGTMWNDTVIEAVRRAPAQALDLRGLPVPALAGQAPVLDGAASRRAAALDILRHIKYMPFDERERAAQAVAVTAGVRPRRDLMMRSEQVRALRRAGMTIGAHTVRHPILALLDEAEIRREVGECKRALESLLGQRVDLFAYPNGQPQRDYGPEAVRAVLDCGFEAAVSTAKGVASYGIDSMQLPRFTPWDHAQARFVSRLAHNIWSIRDVQRV
jgi:peptidoglycan/xylan/chitin deacetylase (PgdA/CDA1 family)